MHNTRKLEEISNSEDKPQRRLLNKTDIVECVCLWLWMSVCVLHPLWFESFTNFIERILRDKTGLFQCVLLCPPVHIYTVKA